MKKKINIPKVSVLIRAFNESKWINICLKKISEQNIKPLEIIVVDNKSNDGTIEIIKKFYKKKLFRNIYYLKSKIFLNRHEINCLNGGGTLIQFGKTLKNAINIGNKDSKINIENTIFSYAIKMNKIIK